MTIPVLGGFTFPPIDELFRWKAFFLSGTPFAMNKTVLLILVSVTVLSTLFVVATRNMELVPGKLQNVAEMGWEFVDQGIVRDVIGPDAAGWSSFMATLFFFILFLNIWEVIPIMQFPPTSRMAVPLYLAIQSYIIMIVVGIAVQGPWQYFKGSIVPPGVPEGDAGPGRAHRVHLEVHGAALLAQRPTARQHDGGPHPADGRGAAVRRVLDERAFPRRRCCRSSSR